MYPLNNFGLHANVTDDGTTIIRNDDGNMLYLGIDCPAKTNTLHQFLRNITPINDWLFTFVPPTLFINGTDVVIAAQCFNDVSVGKLPATWFFSKAPTYNTTRRNWKERSSLYASLNFKKFIWSIVKFVPLFIMTSFRPIFDLNQMYISTEGNVIFSSFEYRGTHNISDDAKDVSKLIKQIVKNKARFSETLKKELSDFCNWLEGTHFGLRSSADDAFTRAVFWSPNMRVDYTCQLFNYVASGNSVFPLLSDAFKVGNVTNWRTVITNSGNPVLDTFIQLGDADYDTKLNEYMMFRSIPKPSNSRASNMGVYSDEQILKCGIYRLRDGYCHLHENAQVYIEAFQGIMCVTNLQSIIQQTFPSHMIEFARAQHLFQYNAKMAILREFVESSASTS